MNSVFFAIDTKPFYCLIAAQGNIFFWNMLDFQNNYFWVNDE
jgi:hypothetical protein